MACQTSEGFPPAGSQPVSIIGKLCLHMSFIMLPLQANYCNLRILKGDCLRPTCQH